MKRFLFLVAIALLAAAPALLLRLSGSRLGPVADAAIFGAGILAAGFLLSWGAEAAERHIAQGLVLAAVALVTVLPEYAVDLYYAYQAGQGGPGSTYVHYAAANMTGANRLLVGLAWPLLIFVQWLRTRRRAIELGDGNAIEISFLLLASLYAFVILFKAQIGLTDFAVLAAIYAAYIWRVRHVRKADDADDEGEPGPAAAFNDLPVRQQWATMAALAIVACGVILLAAEPFAESMVESGRALGINEFLLIQWLAPLASEAPAVSVAVLFVLAGRAAGGLTTMISDKINQWTLLVGMLPVAMSIGGRVGDGAATRRAAARGVLSHRRAIAAERRASSPPSARPAGRVPAPCDVRRAGGPCLPLQGQRGRHDLHSDGVGVGLSCSRSSRVASECTTAVRHAALCFFDTCGATVKRTGFRCAMIRQFLERIHFGRGGGGSSTSALYRAWRVDSDSGFRALRRSSSANSSKDSTRLRLPIQQHAFIERIAQHAASIQLGHRPCLRRAWYNITGNALPCEKLIHLVVVAGFIAYYKEVVITVVGVCAAGPAAKQNYCAGLQTRH